MKKRVFIVALLSLILAGIISIIITLSYFKDNSNNVLEYSGETQEDVTSKDFALDGYNCCEVENKVFKSYSYIGEGDIIQIDNNYIISSDVLSSCNFNVGDIVSKNQPIGIKIDGTEYRSSYNGIILKIDITDPGIIVSYSNISALGFRINLSSDSISYINYDLEVDVFLQNHLDPITSYVHSINYSDIDGINAVFKFKNLNGNEIFPNFKIKYCFVDELLGNQLCVPVSFLDSYFNYSSLNSVSKAIEIFYIENNNIQKTVLTTGIVNNNYIQIFGDSKIQSGMKIFRKVN